MDFVCSTFESVTSKPVTGQGILSYKSPSALQHQANGLSADDTVQATTGLCNEDPSIAV